MTSYCFAYYCLGRGGESSDKVSDSHSKSASWLGELECVRNKLAMSGKPIPHGHQFARAVLQRRHNTIMTCGRVYLVLTQQI